MGDLAGRPGLGLKQPKPPKQYRKPIPKISPKKRAHKAAEKAAGALEHMAWVKALPCLVCGAYGVEVHHEGKPRSGFNVLPLCPAHHRREYGPGAYHYSPSAFYAMHGSSAELLAMVTAMKKEGPSG
jgi:hypothetical protein